LPENAEYCDEVDIEIFYPEIKEEKEKKELSFEREHRIAQVMNE
jgi:hypothetical protein